jgi:hypothetical protein
MRVKAVALALAAATVAGDAAAQTYDGVADCERHAKAVYGRDSDFKSFVIDRRTVEEERFDNKIGTQHVETIWRGRATYTNRREMRSRSFICLHAGGDKGALFIYMMPR